MAKIPKPAPVAPVWQSVLLQVSAVCAVVAIEAAGMAYSMQSASAAQVLDLGGGMKVHTDVVLKSVMSVAAGLSVVYGPTIALHFWRRGGARKRVLTVLAAAVSVVGFFVSASNLSGYTAWTRTGRDIEVTRANPFYAMAVADAEAVQAGRKPYLPSEERAILLRGQTQTTATRPFGDVLKAGAILLLVSGMATGFRLPTRQQTAPRQQRRRSGKRTAQAANDAAPAPLRSVG